MKPETKAKLKELSAAADSAADKAVLWVAALPYSWAVIASAIAAAFIAGLLAR